MEKNPGQGLQTSQLAGTELEWVPDMAVGAAGCLHREQSEHLLCSGKELRDTELGSEPETQLGSHTLQETWRGKQMLLIRPQFARM